MDGGAFIAPVGAALALGAAVGLLYDALRPPRRRAAAPLAFFLDLIFTLLAGGGVFLLGMSAENGALGLWELTAVLAGLLLYTHLFSDRVCAFFTRVLDALSAAAARAVFRVKKTAALGKKLFQKASKCFIIKRRHETNEK